MKVKLLLCAGPSLVVESALSQNEVVIVEVKLRCVTEENFPNLVVERVVVDVYFKDAVSSESWRAPPKIRESHACS